MHCLDGAVHVSGRMAQGSCGCVHAVASWSGMMVLGRWGLCVQGSPPELSAVSAAAVPELAARREEVFWALLLRVELS